MQLFQWKHFNLENVEMITKEHEKFKPQPQTFLMYKLIHPDAPVHAVRHETLMKCGRCMDAKNG